MGFFVEIDVCFYFDEFEFGMMEKRVASLLLTIDQYFF